MSDSFAARRGGLADHLGDDLAGYIARCVEGEEQAYLAVYNLFADTIYRLCFGFLQNREDAEEVLQDTFEYAFRKIERFDSQKASFKTWLYQIAVSRCRNKRRRKWLKTVSIAQLLSRELKDERNLSPDQNLQLSERQEEIWRALAQLSPKLRETAILRYYENLTYREIGEILSIPSKTAESRMRLAHQALKASLEHLSDQRDGP